MLIYPAWIGYDRSVLDHFIAKIGCKAPHWQSKRITSNCSNIQQITNSLEPVKHYTFAEFLNEVHTPCQSIEMLGVNYAEDKYENLYPNGAQKEKLFDIILRFRDMHRFKEIKQVKSYDSQRLIGNAGGYIGLFLGGLYIAPFFKYQNPLRSFVDG